MLYLIKRLSYVNWMCYIEQLCLILRGCVCFIGHSTYRSKRLQRWRWGDAFDPSICTSHLVEEGRGERGERGDGGDEGGEWGV